MFSWHLRNGHDACQALIAARDLINVVDAREQMTALSRGVGCQQVAGVRRAQAASRSFDVAHWLGAGRTYTRLRHCREIVMDWLAQNWIWVVIAIAIVWFLASRGGHAHGGHMGTVESNLPGGMNHFGHAGATGSAQQAMPAPGVPEAALDPVSGQAVRGVDALTSVYQGNVYYFASKENRERFEAAPQAYAAKAAGHPVQPAPATGHSAHRHGC